MRAKRFIVSALLLLFIVILLVITPKLAFLRVGLSPLNPTKITYLYCFENEETDLIMKNAVDRFNKTYGREIGIYVDAKNYRSVEYISERVEEKLVGPAGSFTIGDINTVTYEIGYLAKTMNKIASFEDYIGNETYIEGFLERGRYTSDSKRYVFPLDNSTSVLYVNYDLWEQFTKARPNYDESVFETWEGLAQVAHDYYDWATKAFNNKKAEGRAFLAFESPEDYLMVGSNQLMASIVQPGHKEIRLNLDKRKLFTLWSHGYEAFVSGGFSLNRWTKVEDMLASGEILAYIAPMKNVKDFPLAYRGVDGVKETKLKVFDFPSFKNQKKVCPLSGEATIVMKSSYKKEFASFCFLEWLVKQEEYVDICFNEMSIPLSTYKTAIDRVENLVSGHRAKNERVKNHIALVYDLAKEQVFYSRPYAPVSFPGRDMFIEELVDSFYDNIYLGLLEVERLMDEEGLSRKEASPVSASQEMFEEWFDDISYLTKKY